MADNIDPVPTQPPTIRSVTLSAGNTTQALGSTLQLTATAKDKNAGAVGGTSFFWESSNPNVATVSQTGLVTFTSGRTQQGHNPNKAVGGQALIRAFPKRADGSVMHVAAAAEIVVTAQGS